MELVAGPKMSWCKHYPKGRVDTDCAECDAERRSNPISFVCSHIDYENGVVTFDVVLPKNYDSSTKSSSKSY